jgi:hypothetical protein
MKVDFVLVGPWDRVCEYGIPKQDFLDYISYIRGFNITGKVIYSSSDASGVVDSKLFDVVCSNSILLNNEATGALYYANSKIGIDRAESEFVIRVRSDLFLNELEFIFNVLASNSEKIVIDYHVDHTLLIPYYYSDFFLAAKTTKAKKLYSCDIAVLLGNEKLLSLSPHKFLTAGHFTKHFKYNEYLAWSLMMKNFGFISSVQEMHQLSFGDYVNSLNVLKSFFVLVDRKKIFCENLRFQFSKFPNVFFFKSGIFRFNLGCLLLLYVYHGFQFLYRTMRIGYAKFFKF